MAQYDLVFEGGGAKGMAFVGALTVFAQAGHKYRRLVGTSAGAITATLTGAGYTPQELRDVCTEKVRDKRTGDMVPVFATFMDAPVRGNFSKAQVENSDTMRLLGNVPFLHFGLEEVIEGLLKIDLYRELFSFDECGGFYAGDAALNWIRDRLVQKGMKPDVTWKDFAARTGSDVSVVTTNTTDKESIVLNARTAPDCPVAESVRMSMSIPFVWREVVWNEAWGTYMGRDLTVGPLGPCIFVDGGVLSNFPLWLVDSPMTDQVKAIMGETDPSAAGTIGLYLDSKQMVPGANAAPATPRPRLRLADRTTGLIDTMTDSHDLTAMKQRPNEICRIPVGGYGTTEFRMSPEKQQLLIDSGTAAMTSYLKTLPA